MKTFKIAQLLAVALVFVVGSMSARCCRRSCEPKASSCVTTCATCPVIKLPVDQVQYQKVITESCGQPPSVKYYVRKEVIPCENKNTERVECFTTCPKYLGTFDEDTGAQLD
jgi:hypothetical protein